MTNDTRSREARRRLLAWAEDPYQLPFEDLAADIQRVLAEQSPAVEPSGLDFWIDLIQHHLPAPNGSVVLEDHYRDECESLARAINDALAHPTEPQDGSSPEKIRLHPEGRYIVRLGSAAIPQVFSGPELFEKVRAEGQDASTGERIEELPFPEYGAVTLCMAEDGDVLIFRADTIPPKAPLIARGDSVEDAWLRMIDARGLAPTPDTGGSE